MNSQFHLLPRFWQWLWKVLQILCSPIVDKQSLHIIPWPTEAILIHNNHSLAPGCWKGREERAVSCWKGGVFGSLRCGRAAFWGHQLGEPSAARGRAQPRLPGSLLAFSSPASLLITSFIHSSQQKYFQRNNGRINGQREASESRNTSVPGGGLALHCRRSCVGFWSTSLARVRLLEALAHPVMFPTFHFSDCKGKIIKYAFHRPLEIKQNIM